MTPSTPPPLHKAHEAAAVKPNSDLLAKQEGVEAPSVKVVGFTTLLQQFSGRYRAALLTKAAVLAGLGVSCCGLLAWRLSALPMDARWRVGPPFVLATALFAGVGWWLRRHWMDRRAAATYLDETLGLKQQLITADEFSRAPTASPLYPMLVEELDRQLSTDRVRFPRPLNHTAGVLAVALLLLLLWPRLNAVLPPTLRQPEIPPAATPPQQQQATSDQRQEEQHAAQSAQQTGDKEQGAGAGQRQQTRGGQQQQSAGGNQQSSTAGQQRQPSAGSQQGQPTADSKQQTGAQRQPTGQNQQPAAGNQQPSGGAQPGQAEGQQQTAGDQQPARASGTQGASQTGSPGRDEHASKMTQSSEQRQGQAGPQQQQQASGNAQQGARSGQDGRQQSAQGQQSGQGQRMESPAARDGSGSQGAGQSFGDGAALKADIQRLLKEMSGELKNLEAQIEAAKDQPQPRAGTGTDPNLYGDSTTLDEANPSNPLPLPLQTDNAPTTKGGRPGGGVGKPSGEVSGAAPQVQAQEAQLSEQPLDEAAASRQPVPAEYRSVFDQLRREEKVVR